MKRFVSALLAVAMLLSFCPMVLAEEAAAAIEAAQPDVTAEEAEQPAETAEPTETETPIKEETPAPTVQTALTMPMADLTEEATSEVVYTKDGGTTWTSSTLADAVTTIAKGTGTIKVLKDITLTQGLYIMGDITIIPGDKDVTIKRGFATGTETTGGQAGDSMFVIYKISDSYKNYYTSTAQLTLGSENDTHTITIDGNANKWGTKNKGVLISITGQYSTPDRVAKCTINKNVILQNNTNCAIDYLGYGSAIKITNGVELTITGATIKNCSAGKYGGAIYYDGTAYQNSFQAKINLDSVTFEGNSAQRGGAIYYDSSVTTLKNCKFINNTSTQYGGAALYVKGISSTLADVVPMLTIDGCSFIGHQSTGHKYGSASSDYATSNVIDFDVKPVKENTVIFKNKVTFSDNTTDSDICLGTSAFGSASYNGVLYLDDSFTTDNQIKVMCGQHVVSGITNVTAPLFKCSSADKAAAFVTQFTPVAFASSSKTDSVIQAKDAAFAVNETDNTAISLVEYEDPEVEYTYTTSDSEGTTVTKQGTLKKALAVSGNSKVISLLKDLTIDESIALTSSLTLQSKEGARYTITRADGFTSEMITVYDSNAVSSTKPTIQNIIFDGSYVSGAQSILGIYKGAGGCTLKNVTLKNNKNEERNNWSGGGIYVRGGTPTLDAENVVIENCSAAEGGAVNILADSKTSSASYTFKNCTFTNNKATAGSAIFMKSSDGGNWFGLTLEGCTFTQNDFMSLSDAINNASGVSIDGATTHTVVYVGIDPRGNSSTVTFSSYVNLWGDTTFSNNGETVSDILLDEGFANLTESANLELGTGYNGSSLFANKGTPIRIAVGSYSRANEDGEETFGYNAVKDKKIISKNSSTNKFPGAFVLAPTYGATLSGEHLLKEDVRYFTIGEPSLVQMQYIANNSITAAAINDTDADTKGFTSKTNRAVTLSVSPAVVTEYNNLICSNVDKVYENKTYTLTAKAADNVNIKSISVGAVDNPYKETYRTLSSGTVEADEKTASVTITPEILTQVLANLGGSTCCILIEYDQFVTLTIGAIETGKNAIVTATAADGTTTVSAGQTQTIPAGKVTFACSGDDFGYIESAAVSGFKGNDTAPYIESLTDNAVINVHYKHTTTVVENDNGTAEVQHEKLAKKGTTKLYEYQYNKQMVILRPKDNYQLLGATIKTASGETISLSTLYYNQAAKGAKDDWVSASDFSQQGDYCFVFYMPDDDVIVTPTYKALNKTITIDSSITNGSITTNPAGEASPGNEVTITATADEFYELDTITVKTASETKVTVNDNKFTMPDEDVTVSATFKKQQFAVTTQTDGNGTITVFGTSPFDWDDEVIFSVSANAYYELDTLTATGLAADEQPAYDPTSGTYKFTMPTNAVTLHATFKKKQYTVTTEGANVTFAPTSGTYTWDNTVTLTITPDTWYDIVDITTDVAGVSLIKVEGADNQYTFTMPHSNIHIKVTTNRPTYNITFNSMGGTAVDGAVVDRGNTVTRPKVPERLNYGFAGWYTSTDFKPENKYNFEQPVTGDITLYARWFLWGDVNGDGKANTLDASIIQRYVVGIIPEEALKQPRAGIVSDVAKAKVNTLDASLIQRYVVGIVNVYPVEIKAKGYEFDLENDIYYAPGTQR